MLDDSSKAADERCYSLPAAHVGVLAEEDHAAHVAPFAHMLEGRENCGDLPEGVAQLRTLLGDLLAQQRGLESCAKLSDAIVSENYSRLLRSLSLQ